MSPEEAISTIPSLITPEMNAKLSIDFMLWEVQVALKQMASLKTPSPDGMPPLFYQNYWKLVCIDVSQSVLSFLNSTSLPQHLNHTFITLVLKVNNLELVYDFKPISLLDRKSVV